MLANNSAMIIVKFRDFFNGDGVYMHFNYSYKFNTNLEEYLSDVNWIFLIASRVYDLPGRGSKPDRTSESPSR